MSVTAWRMTKAEYEQTAFDGEGARRFGGRINSKGIPVVYTAATPSLVVLEILANLQFDQPLGSYVLIPATSCEYSPAPNPQRTTDHGRRATGTATQTSPRTSAA